MACSWGMASGPELVLTQTSVRYSSWANQAAVALCVLLSRLCRETTALLTNVYVIEVTGQVLINQLLWHNRRQWA